MQEKKWRTTYCSELYRCVLGEHVVIAGWIEEKRNLGSLLFLSIRDCSGKIQAIVDQKNAALYDCVAKLTRESAVSLEGTVKKRLIGKTSSDMLQESVELEVEKILFASPSAPFPINLKETIHEEADLRYRYLTMRKPEVLARYKSRARITAFIRDALTQKNFIEVETPILTKPTPEGARDYLVPSRVHPGSFYALPQSPQLFKQLCMIGGLDRYFQIARCFRDEDLRADRQPEFTQVDIEASFLDPSELRMIVEKIVKELWEKEWNILVASFPIMTYAETMRNYGSDKPDLRFDYSIIDVKETLNDSSLVKNERMALLRVPQVSSWSRNQWDNAMKSLKKRANQSEFVVLDCKEVSSNLGEKNLVERSTTRFSTQEKAAILHKSQAEIGDAVILVSGPEKEVNISLGELRTQFPKKVPSIILRKLAPLWVVDFPMFERDENGLLQPLHHPFTAAKFNAEELSGDPTEWVADAYDLVINGYEIGGGSRRIVDSAFQKKVFSLLSISEEEQKTRFGFFLNALSFGAPIHCGIALGLDRIVMLLTHSEQLRDVIAFPKTAAASCLMTQAPTLALEESLKTLKLKVIEDSDRQ